MIKMENGAFKNSQGQWEYHYTDEQNGPQTVLFTVPEGEVPEIGDFISGGVLEKRKGYQISNEGKLKWPSDNPQPNHPDKWFDTPVNG